MRCRYHDEWSCDCPMPKELEDRLKRTAVERGYSEKRTDKYVYGTLAKLRRRRKERSVG